MALRRPRRPEVVDTADQEFRPGTVRVLAVVWWVFSALLAVDLVLRGGAGQLLVGVPLVLLSAVVVHALFWHPAVRVSDDHVELVNVLRTVRIPWSSLEQLDTRWALTLVAGGHRWTAWAAPSSGRRYRPVARRETPWAGRDDAAIAGSRAARLQRG